MHTQRLTHGCIYICTILSYTIHLSLLTPPCCQDDTPHILRALLWVRWPRGSSSLISTPLAVMKKDLPAQGRISSLRCPDPTACDWLILSACLFCLCGGGDKHCCLLIMYALVCVWLLSVPLYWLEIVCVWSVNSAMSAVLSPPPPPSFSEMGSGRKSGSRRETHERLSSGRLHDLKRFLGVLECYSFLDIYWKSLSLQQHLIFPPWWSQGLNSQLDFMCLSLLTRSVRIQRNGSGLQNCRMQDFKTPRF